MCVYTLLLIDLHPQTLYSICGTHFNGSVCVCVYYLLVEHTLEGEGYSAVRFIDEYL